MNFGKNLFYLVLILLIIIAGRYLIAHIATEQIADASERMSEKVVAQSKALQAEAAARMAAQAKLEAVRRRYQSVVGCANQAEVNRCTCFDANAQQVPDIPMDICLKVMEGGLELVAAGSAVDRGS